MDPEDSILFSSLLVFLLLVFSAFFSGMEIAFVSANRLKVELDRKTGSVNGRLVAYFARHPKLFISSMLVGNNAAMVAYAIIAGDLIITLMFGHEPISTLPKYWLILLLQTAITTILVLVSAEFIPKALFSNNPNRWLKMLALPLAFVSVILFIPAWIVTALSNQFIGSVLKGETETQLVEFGKVDLHHYMEEFARDVEDAEEIDHEIQIFQNALDFSKLKARECMVPRNEIVAEEIGGSLEDLRIKFVSTGLSKILIYRDSIDNIIGYVHSYELFKKPAEIKNILLPVAIVPEPMPANEVLESLIQQKRNMAVVVDEFGGTAGILTMEDIVEEIFGEIEDEHDKEVMLEEQLGEKHFKFSARLEINYINDKYKVGLPEVEEFDTLGGLVIHECEAIPEEGSVIQTEKFRFMITSVSENRVDEVELEIRD
jgi:putative hemolysin